MNVNDEELQKKIETGVQVNLDNQDARAYHEVFSALSKEPVTKISPTFADRMVARVVEKKRKSEARDYFWLGCGLLFLLTGFMVALAVVGPTLHLGFLNDMSGYAGLFVFGIVIIAAFNWLDRRLVQKNTNRESGLSH